MPRILGFVAAGGRLEESEAGLARIGISGERQLHHLDEPDGGLHENNDSFAVIADTVDRAIETHDINRVVTLGPLGYTWHTDHIATHNAGVAAVKNQRAAGRQIVHAALNAFGTGELEVPATLLGIRRKLAAMAEHDSQYPIRPVNGYAGDTAIIQGYAIDKKFWGSFVCRGLVLRGETYDLI